MNLVIFKAKKLKEELTPLKKSNSIVYFSYCEDIYNSGKFNFTVMEWAIKEIIKEEREEEVLKKKAEEEERRLNG